MNNLMIVAVLSAIALGANAEEFVSASSSAQVSATQVTQPEIGKVLVKGVGTTKEQALKDAYRDAVERAVGLYIDAETQVCNDAVIKDEILTHSNAYIETFEVVDESQERELFKVRILATVKAREKGVREAYHWTVFDLPTAILPEVKFIKVDGAIDFQK